MKKIVTFSIVTVSFNSQKTIERTIESVLGQTYHNIEYCIVDGNSKDGTVDIIKKYHSQYPDIIKYVSEPDKGIYDAMNKGIRMTTGDIIGIVNSDDWLEPNALQIVYDSLALNNFNLDCLYTGGIKFRGKNKDIVMLPDMSLMKKKSKQYFMGGIKHPATFVPRKVYDAVGLYDTDMRISADADFILRCYFEKVCFVIIPNVLSNMSEGGISTDYSLKTINIGCRDYIKRLDKYKINTINKYYLTFRYRVVGMMKMIKYRLF